MVIQIRTSLAEPETGQSFVPHRPERPPKAESGKAFRIVSDYEPAGDQPQAIAELVAQAKAGERDQVLLGVTGSGKTFTMAKVVEALQRPALVLAPNKILAAQLYGEFKSFFPEQRGRILRQLLRLLPAGGLCPPLGHLHREGIGQRGDRPDAPFGDAALLERDDVLIVASVSCLYGIGSVETYSAMTFRPQEGPDGRSARDHPQACRAAIQAQRRRLRARRFRVRGDNLEIFPSHL
jgi:excinuclease ABC subunit B